jgi:hypothetical protein
MLSALLVVLLVATAVTGEVPSKAPAPTAFAVKVLQPNGGEVWTENTSALVQWELTPATKTDSVRIRLSWQVMVEGKPTTASRLLATIRGESPGQWTWEDVGPVGQGMRIQVEAFAPEKVKVSDTSDEDFAIVAEPAREEGSGVVVLSPNGGEKWTLNTTQTVAWEVNSPVQPDSIRIRLTWKIEGVKDASRLLTTIRGEQKGEWEWENVGPVRERMKIQVEAFFPERKRASDTSDDEFAIVE